MTHCEFAFTFCTDSPHTENTQQNGQSTASRATTVHTAAIRTSVRSSNIIISFQPSVVYRTVVFSFLCLLLPHFFKPNNGNKTTTATAPSPALVCCSHFAIQMVDGVHWCIQINVFDWAAGLTAVVYSTAPSAANYQRRATKVIN